jgi:penicillin-binding protein 2
MQIYANRKNVIYFIFIIISVFILFRLFYLQIITKKYQQFAQNNVLQVRTIYPPRGLIYDRKGKLMVSNEAVYDLMLIPGIMKIPDTLELCEILDIDISEFCDKIQKARKYSLKKPSLIYRNMTQDVFGKLQERLFRYTGFYVSPRTIRKYPYATSAHILGYTGEIPKENIKGPEDYYKTGDYIGINGLEEYYEEELRGVKGEKYILVDVFNTEKGSYADGTMDKKAINGNHLLTSIDVDLQSYAQELLKNKKGGLVAIIPSTGEVLAMASSPAYNPALLGGRKRGSYYNDLLRDPDIPLFNRAITAAYPPASTFKVIMALIGQKEEVITPSTTYFVRGAYYLPGLVIGDHIHGPVDLNTSIVKSSNAYYCHVFRNLIDMEKFNDVEQGFMNWREAVMEFGIGKKLGIDLPNESAGILPTVERYDRIYGKKRWKSSNILSLAIGQAEISTTVLQLANCAAIIANRGFYIRPHLVNSIVKNNSNYMFAYKKHNLSIDSAFFVPVIDAMRDVLRTGTAIRYGTAFDSLNICGKTGTAQNPHGENHSVFLAFAPKDNPQIAVAAVIENAGQGAHFAAPICFLLINKYFNGYMNERRKWIETHILETDFLKEETDSLKLSTKDTFR